MLFWPAFIWQIFEKKYSAGCLLKRKRRMKKSSKTENCNLMRKFECLWKYKFWSATLFLEGSQLNFSSPKTFFKWKQVKITNMILQRPQVQCKLAQRRGTSNLGEVRNHCCWRSQKQIKNCRDFAMHFSYWNAIKVGWVNRQKNFLISFEDTTNFSYLPNRILPPY